MEIIKPGINIDFVGIRRIAYTISAVFILATFILLIWRGGPNYGVDFAGGVMIQVKFDQVRTPDEIKNALEPIQLQDSIIQEFGEKGLFEYLIRVNKPEIKLEGLSAKVKNSLESAFGQGVEIRRVEMVGPKVGEDLRQKALMALFFSLLFMGVYISWRFEFKLLKSLVMVLALGFVVAVAFSFGASITWLILIAMIVTLLLYWLLDLKYALGAIIALIHDVIITVGAMVLMNKEFSLEIVAAILTIIGYSINDTIVIFDRIRENIKRNKKLPFAEVMNKAINETLSRTILTSGLTIIVVVALFIMGGGVIHDFAFAMIVGMVSGVYSTIFIASPILLLWERKGGKRKNINT